VNLCHPCSLFSADGIKKGREPVIIGLEVLHYPLTQQTTVHDQWSRTFDGCFVVNLTILQISQPRVFGSNACQYVNSIFLSLLSLLFAFLMPQKYDKFTTFQLLVICIKRNKV